MADGRRVARRRLAWAALALGLVLGVVAAVMGWQASRVRADLAAAQPLVPRLQAQVTDGDLPAAEQTLAELQERTSRAAETTGGPLWSVTARLPWVGDDVHAVREVAAVVDEVAATAMPALLEAAQGATPQALAPRDGVVDLGPLVAAREPLGRAEASMSAAADRVAAVETESALGQVAGPVETLQAQLADAAGTVATAHRLATVLPPMLGADGPRTYLLLFQNNAEVRATGGLPGSLAVVRADGGRIDFLEQVPAAVVPQFDEPVLPLEGRALPVHGERAGVYVGDVNFSPHFPTAAELAREMWRRVSAERGEETVVDGVVAVDPVALSYLLEATGPIPVEGVGVELTAESVVPLLLSDSYRLFGPRADQDAFFAAATSAVTRALLGGDVDPRALVDQVGRAADEGRLLVWSSVPAEQEALVDLGVAGVVPTGDEGRRTVGIYLNDGTGAKMSWYLRERVVLEPACDTEDATHRLALELSSTAPADAAQSLPEYVTGGSFGVPRGEFRTQVLVFAPLDGGVVRGAVDGEPVALSTFQALDRQVAVFDVQLGPGESRTVEVELDVAADGLLELDTTPLAVPVDAAVTSHDCYER
ncbi:DUF4012 domain-containing protein [Thalassiella azotivora]